MYAVAPSVLGKSWLWTLAHGYHDDRTSRSGRSGSLNEGDLFNRGSDWTPLKVLQVTVAGEWTATLS